MFSPPNWKRSKIKGSLNEIYQEEVHFRPDKSPSSWQIAPAERIVVKKALSPFKGVVALTKEQVANGGAVKPSASEQGTNEVARLLLENREGTADWGEISHLQGVPCPKKVANEFVLCCLLDYQIPTNTAWDNGHRLVRDILHDPDDIWHAITSFSESAWATKWSEYRLHRFPAGHKRLWRIGKEICARYGGDARNIWEGRDSRGILERLEALGAGEQISRMIVGALRDLGRVKGASDVKADSHVCRALGRAITGTEASPSKGAELARQLCPSDPWQLDWPLWTLAKDHCFRTAPDCSGCYLRRHCVYAGRH
jgi:hypothetical protein